MRRERAGLSLATVVLFTVACGGSPPDPASIQARALGATIENLGDGRIATLTEGTLYIQFLEIPQAVGGTLTHSHIAGYVYVVAGLHRLSLAGGETKDLGAAQAAFVPPETRHTHTNPGMAESLWYFISIRPNTARAGAPPFPGQHEVFGTPDLPALATGPYTMSLRAVTLQPNGRTAAHKHGGIEAILVLAGSVETRVRGTRPTRLTTGMGIHIMPDTPLQIRNTGPSAARLLAYFITAEGKAFSTDVDAAP